MLLSFDHVNITTTTATPATTTTTATTSPSAPTTLFSLCNATGYSAQITLCTA